MLNIIKLLFDFDEKKYNFIDYDKILYWVMKVGVLRSLL